MPFDFPFDDWADIYDAVHADLTHDIDFYVELARESGGPVLELGCGTGRISLAIAREGVAVTGIDISPRMIEVAQEKAAKRGLAERCVFQSGDMATLQLAERFPLVIMPFRSFQSMLTAEEQRNLRDRVNRLVLLCEDLVGALPGTQVTLGEAVAFLLRDRQAATDAGARRSRGKATVRRAAGHGMEDLFAEGPE